MEKFVKHYIDQLIDDFNPYNKIKRMTYEDGLFLIVNQRYFELTGDLKCKDFLLEYLDMHIDESGMICNYVLEDYNIDNILAGNVLFFAYDQTKKEKYLRAIELLYKQLESHPRTKSLNFWHKKRYPFQIWLDGLYMGQVFYLRYALFKNDESMISDIIAQVINTDKLLWDEKRKLYVHAFDERRLMQWADKKTGHSPNVWSRSMGWFAMALVDLIDLIPSTMEHEKGELIELLKKLIDGASKHLDPINHMLYQIVDKPELNGNYLETSGSAMLSYSCIKAFRINVLDESYFTLGKSILSGIANKYLDVTSDKITLGGICAVAGLDNERRDGSDAYYLSEPVATNEIKGVAPYLFSCIELLRLEQITSP